MIHSFIKGIYRNRETTNQLIFKEIGQGKDLEFYLVCSEFFLGKADIRKSKLLVPLATRYTFDWGCRLRWFVTHLNFYKDFLLYILVWLS